ncbi:MAG TPA: heme peroxidase family protein [Solirubrobacteraceae bacterium]|nr:heme peroxidase family protein [Solirubrobacteraceae bacterium]
MGAGGGRFGKLFSDEEHLALGDPGRNALRELARRLVLTQNTSTQNLWLPAGYTYLGQFIDHDITFDPTSKLDRDNDPAALRNFRTPRFDLDSLYGAGPLDQPFLYDSDADSVRGRKTLRGLKLLVGHNTVDGTTVDDLPRNDQNRALVGDPRNDENIIVSQLQLLFIHFHNKVVDRLLDSHRRISFDDALDQVQRTVQWHYQWIVVHDFLPKVVGKDMARSVLRPGRKGAAPTVHRKFYDWKDTPYMPVEFSGAAYRFGHSMVRPNYVMRDMDRPVSVFGPARRAMRHAPSQDLSGRRRLPPELEIRWENFFKTTPVQPVNVSMLIDPYLAPTLRRVPPTGKPLALLNLMRGVRLELPAGRDVATKMDAPPLSADHLLKPLEGMDEAITAKVLERTPLWYYVLCEANSPAGSHGYHLGPVGGRIVAEVLVGLLQGDESSYLSVKPTWKPELPSARKDDFTMADLVRYAQGKTPL